MQVNGVDMNYSTPLTWTVQRHIHMTTGDELPSDARPHPLRRDHSNCWRNMNFCTLPVEVLGRGVKMMRLGALK